MFALITTLYYNEMMTNLELKALRKNHCLTMKTLAEKLGVSLQCVAHWEYGIRKISKISEKAILSILTKINDESVKNVE